MPELPLVSVVLAVLDGEQYIADALDSVLGQSLGDFECIVIDDGSTDDTAGILRDYARRDARLVVVHQENRGLIASLNRGCRLVRGQYIARLDADDVSVPDRFAKQVAFLERHPAVAVVGGALKLMTPTGTSFNEWRCPLDDRQIKEALQRGNCLRHSAIMMRKTAFDAAGGYRRPFVHAEDYDLWLRMSERFEMANLPDVLVHCRVHPRQVSATNLRQQTLSSLAAQAAARLRRDTGEDPPLPEPGVTVETLGRLGVRRDRVTQELIRRHLLWAGDMMEIGAYGPAEALLHETLGLCPADGAPGQMADIQVSIARCQYLRRNPAGALRSLARAVALRPAVAPGLLRYAWLAASRSRATGPRSKPEGLPLHPRGVRPPTRLRVPDVADLGVAMHLMPRVATGFRARAPRVIDLELTNRCNLRCKMCWFYGENGVGDAHRGNELSRDDVFRVVDQAAKFQARLYLGGAEPLLRRDFLEILTYIKSRGLFVSFTTNGTLLDPARAEALVRLGVDHVSFSVDGVESVHDGIRGAGAYQRVVGAIRELANCRARSGSARPAIAVNMTVSEQLAGRLQEAIRAVADATNDAVDRYRIHQLWFITESELRAHQAATQRFLGCASPGAAGHLIPSSQLPDARPILDELRALEGWPKVQSFPRLSHEALLRYYAEGKTFDQRCVAPFTALIIKPNGDVKFCPDEWIDDYVLGNVRTESLETIWNNAKARRFRSALFRQKCFPGCKRCNFMYSIRQV